MIVEGAQVVDDAALRVGDAVVHVGDVAVRVGDVVVHAGDAVVQVGRWVREKIDCSTLKADGQAETFAIDGIERMY